MVIPSSLNSSPTSTLQASMHVLRSYAEYMHEKIMRL